MAAILKQGDGNQISSELLLDICMYYVYVLFVCTHEVTSMSVHKYAYYRVIKIRSFQCQPHQKLKLLKSSIF